MIISTTTIIYNLYFIFIKNNSLVSFDSLARFVDMLGVEINYWFRQVKYCRYGISGISSLYSLCQIVRPSKDLTEDWLLAALGISRSSPRASFSLFPMQFPMLLFSKLNQLISLGHSWNQDSSDSQLLFFTYLVREWLCQLGALGTFFTSSVSLMLYIYLCANWPTIFTVKTLLYKINIKPDECK